MSKQLPVFFRADVVLILPSFTSSMAHISLQTKADSSNRTQDGLLSVDSNSAVRQVRYNNAPKHEISYCDERLRELDISFWTNVKVTNDLAARIISLYMRTDHPLLGLFSPNLFISDLVAKKETHCSRFLLHALMYLGSVSAPRGRLKWLRVGHCR